MEVTQKHGHSHSAAAERPAWKALEAHYKKVRELHLRKLFAETPSAASA